MHYKLKWIITWHNNKHIRNNLLYIILNYNYLYRVLRRFFLTWSENMVDLRRVDPVSYQSDILLKPWDLFRRDPGPTIGYDSLNMSNGFVSLYRCLFRMEVKYHKYFTLYKKLWLHNYPSDMCAHTSGRVLYSSVSKHP